MLKSGHYGAALLAYAPVGLLLSSVDVSLAAAGLVESLALARLPDYDLRISFVEHRGATHTLLFLALSVTTVGWVVGAFAGELGVDPSWSGVVAAFVAFLAVGSHLLVDALTPYGIPLLWPATDRRFSAGLVTASNPVANYGLLALGVAGTATVGHVAGAF